MKPVASGTHVDWLAEFWTINRILIGGRVTVLVDFNVKSFCKKLSGFKLQFLNVWHLVLGKSGNVLSEHVRKELVIYLFQDNLYIKLMELHTKN